MKANHIEAMKLALEALECTEYPQDHYDAIVALREALAEQPAQQEFVATVTSESGNPNVSMSWWHEPALPTGTQLYTSPPAQRKPLTDKEIDSFRETNSEGRGAGWRFNFKGFARAIEAAHGIKENT